MDAAIEFSELVKDYGPVRALDGVTLSVQQGDIVGFLGPNGAGKTTAIRILFDLIRPTSGVARVLGHDCQRDSLAARAHMGYLAGDIRLYDGLTGRQTIDLFHSLRPERKDERFVADILARLDLDPTRSVSAYSKGNRQKLALVLAMLHKPDVLVLDEPTSGLDPLVQDQVAAILFERAAAGATVFFSSHVLSEVEKMCHRAAFLRAGRLVAFEDVGALKGRSLHIIEVTFAEAVPPRAFDLPGVREIEREGSRIHLEVRDNLDAALKAIARYEVEDLRTEQPSLEQIFRVYYEADGAATASEYAAS